MSAYSAVVTTGIYGGPGLVCRGVQLVLDGALDRGTEAELGARLGVSARHLRRLFHEHLGTTPDQVARSRRAHFARRLLDDSDLTITQVAFASGFGSVRQLNRACRELFRATPRELRARRRSADRLVADGGLILRLPFRPPLDWDAMLGYFALRAIPGVEAVADGTYRRTIVVDGDPGVIEVSLGGDDHLLLRAHLPHWEGLIHVAQRVRRIFGLDADGDAARAHFGTEPLGLTHTFPPAAALAEADLDGIGLPGARIRAVQGFAAAVAENRVRLDRSVGLDELVDSITALPGLGPWTAHYVALRLGEPDALPASDLGLRRALANGSAPAALPSAGDLAARAESWRPWRALAAVHLWSNDLARPRAA